MFVQKKCSDFRQKTSTNLRTAQTKFQKIEEKMLEKRRQCLVENHKKIVEKISEIRRKDLRKSQKKSQKCIEQISESHRKNLRNSYEFFLQKKNLKFIEKIVKKISKFQNQF